MKRLSIIVKNQAFILEEIEARLAAEKITVYSFYAEQIDESSLIIINVDQYDKTIEILQALDNSKMVTEDVILLRLLNKPGALSKIARRFNNAAIKIGSVRCIQRNAKYSWVTVATQRTEQAFALVADVLIS